MELELKTEFVIIEKMCLIWIDRRSQSIVLLLCNMLLINGQISPAIDWILKLWAILIGFAN